ncbi:MAG: class I SAM-dependent methyltransferase [Candidatus Liptonbacteria bacterium]|nr:class I SAM-dependent methyltransferase [Candidatus Liptonbacteria bacterium]
MEPIKPSPEKCPICFSPPDPGEEIKFVENYQNPKGKWSLYQCPKCRVQFWTPFEYYEADYRSQHIDGGSHFFLPWNYRQFFRFPHPKGARILDIGCGSGEFLALCRDEGYSVYGLEINQGLVNKVKENDIECFFGYLSDFVSEFKRKNIESFDVVTFFEVMEHLIDPIGFLKDANSILKPSGAVVFSVPFRERSEIFKMIDYPPGHLTRWNAAALSYAVRRAGFEPEIIIARPISLQGVAGQFFQSGKLRRFSPIAKFATACFLGLLFWLPLKLSGGNGNRIFVIARKKS